MIPVFSGIGIGIIAVIKYRIPVQYKNRFLLELELESE